MSESAQHIATAADLAKVRPIRDGVVPAPPRPKGLALDYGTFCAIMAKLNTEAAPETRRPHKAPELPPGVVPADAMPPELPGEWPRIAMDWGGGDPQQTFTWLNQQAGFCGLGFPGYAYLSELAQRSEYRAPSETIANEMTRRWIEFISIGTKAKSADADAEVEEQQAKEKGKKLEEIEEAFKAFGIQELFRKCAEQDGFFGRAQLFVNINGQDPMLPLMVEDGCIKKGSLLGFKTIEAIWSTPYSYNSIDPTRADFFKPTSWFVMGRKVHATRLLTMISREVPDLLKPSYNFGGLSMTQLMEPYVNQWLRTRDSVSNMIHSFSLSGLATNMQSTLEGEAGEGIFRRMELFNRIRDNRGLMLLDKDSEEFFQFNTPLGGLADLQAQAQEHMAAPSHIPLVKLLGITPTGLNASSDGEIQVFYDFVSAQQEAFFADPITTVLRIIQLHLYGKIDPSIGYEFVPLHEPTSKELAEERKADADASAVYISSGVISPDEQRDRLRRDPDSGYNDLQGDAPPPLESEDDVGGDGGNDDDA